jgi:hypothetical protein
VARAWNLFLIGRNAGSEDQLTEMLVWLADSVPEVAAALDRLAFGVRDGATDGFELTTQHWFAAGRLDALMTSQQVALIVESKLGSVYGHDQIRRYLEWLDGEFADRPFRGVMTLTAHEAPWSEDDRAFAKERGIVSASRRWADLHELLEPLTDADAEDGLSAQLVREFLEMLTNEGLVPVQPLEGAELETAWADSWRTVRRYRDFFGACKDRIGEMLAADRVPTSRSDRGDWFWQDYVFPDNVRVVVGLFNTDENEKIPLSQRTRAPILFLAAKVEHVDDWPRVVKALEENPPDGWARGNRWWGERPSIWRPLPQLLADASTVDEQREALASAVTVARPWIDLALAEEMPPNP